MKKRDAFIEEVSKKRSAPGCRWRRIGVQNK
jgi:hypothetical protein